MQSDRNTKQIRHVVEYILCTNISPKHTRLLQNLVIKLPCFASKSNLYMLKK